jgi:DNA-binding NtrC family response regulator
MVVLALAKPHPQHRLAVNAAKLGAIDYLAKPVDADDVVAALLALDNNKIDPPENPMSADRVGWEHIQHIDELCGRKVSETARRLNMHRRTLQRILAKRAPRQAQSDEMGTDSPQDCATNKSVYAAVRPVRVGQRLQPQRRSAREG